MLADDPRRLVPRLLDVIEQDVAPLTRAGVARGNKIFGAAVLLKQDGRLVIAGTNEETACPLWHGEISTIRRLYELPASERPAASDCLFLSTHEPCSLCLSAITWAGFDNFHYLFSYEDSRDEFAIPHDLRILEEVFGCRNGAYHAENSYWRGRSLVAEIAFCDEPERADLHRRVEHLRNLYSELSATYQAQKAESEIPLA